MNTNEHCPGELPHTGRISHLLFPLGRTMATSGAVNILNGEIIRALPFLLRHQSGDWGSVHPEDRIANDAAVAFGGRILSCYDVVDERLWIITEADRSATTLLLPEEY
jgi:hypothetical protein